MTDLSAPVQKLEPLDASIIGRFISYSFGLSMSSSVLILPDPRPPILPKAESPLKLLLPSLKFQDRLDFRGFEEPISMSSVSMSSLATTRRAMVLLQNGQTGGFTEAVVGLGLLWQQRARVQ